jgi:hypothetical protein
MPLPPPASLVSQVNSATAGAEVSPVDLPLRLDDTGAPPTTPKGQQQQNVVHF